MTTHSFEAIGTHWSIDLFEELSPEVYSALKTAIADRIAVFDGTYSRFRTDSLVTQMSQKAGVYTLPDDAEILFTFYKKLYDVTNGLVTPFIGQVLSDAGYDAQYSLQQKTTLHSPQFWEETMQYQYPTLELFEPALLDFGAAGKGYLVDIVGEIVESFGITQYCVDAGGDMRHRGTRAITVGLEHPDHTDEVIGAVSFYNCSLCGSAGNRRKWAGMHHIVHPQTLTSPEKILAIWVVADGTITADGLTTALFFVEPELLTEHFEFEYLILHSDYSVKYSQGFKAELFFEEEVR